MSEVRDNKRYAMPQSKQIDVTRDVTFLSFLDTARQKQKRKNKQTNKQTNKKGERKRLTLSCNILHDFVFFGIQWLRKNLRKRGRAIAVILSSFPVSHALGQIT